MSITLLTLSRQYAAGKISKSHYRAHRHALIEEQVFQVEERTVPGFSKEHALMTEATDIDDGFLGENTAEFTQPLPCNEKSFDAAMAVKPPVVEGTTINMRRRMSKLTSSVDEPKGESFVQAYRMLIAASAIGLIVLCAGLSVFFIPSEEPVAVGMEDPIILNTQILLDNPDWQVTEISEYREMVKRQSHEIYPEQRSLLGSINLYLSVPLDASNELLDIEVRHLQADLEALSRRK